MTCVQVSVRHPEDGHKLVDHAISQALLHSKPAYIEVACNLADLQHPSFGSSHTQVRTAALLLKTGFDLQKRTSLQVA